MDRLLRRTGLDGLTQKCFTHQCVFMRTTIDLPQQLLRQAKATAAIEGRSLKEFVADAVAQKLSAGSRTHRRRVQLPLVKSSKPGSVALTGERVAHLIEQDDAAP